MIAYTCVWTGGSRIFVQKGIYDRFVKEFVERSSQLIVGDPKHDSTNVGAIVNEQHMNKILDYIQIAKAEGGKILLGGYRLTPLELEKGFFVAPTIVAM